MRSEDNTPLDQKFHMILGAFGSGLKQVMEKDIASRVEARSYPTREHLTRAIEFQSRDRTNELILYSRFTYADILIGREYSCLWHRTDDSFEYEVNFRVDYVVGAMGRMLDSTIHGHNNLLICSSPNMPHEIIPHYDSMVDLGRDSGQLCLSDRGVKSVWSNKTSHSNILPRPAEES